MKKTILLCFMIWTNIHVFAQDYMFIGIHGLKESRVSYWCQNMTWEKQTLASSAEYNDVKTAFYGMKYDWPSTYLLTPKKAAIVYEATINDNTFRCKHKIIGVIYGNSLQEADSTLMHQLADKPKTYLAGANVLLRWNPKGLPEVFKDKLAKLDVTIRKSKNPGGTNLLQVDATNNTQNKAVVFITDGNKNILKGPYVIQPGSGLQNLVLTNVEKIEFFADYYKAEQHQEQSVIDELKAWIKGEITTPPKEGETEGFDAACMCIRG